MHFSSRHATILVRRIVLIDAPAVPCNGDGLALLSGAGGRRTRPAADMDRRLPRRPDSRRHRPSRSVRPGQSVGRLRPAKLCPVGRGLYDGSASDVERALDHGRPELRPSHGAGGYPDCRGGADLRTSIGDARLGAWIRRTVRRARRIASVCTGAFLLDEAGLLDGPRATTHWVAWDALQRRFPSVQVERDPIFVCDGNVFTSAAGGLI